MQIHAEVYALAGLPVQKPLGHFLAIPCLASAASLRTLSSVF